MKKIQLDRSGIDRLYTALESNLTSLRRRGLSYTISVHASELATVTLLVTGKRGRVQKDYICKYDTFNAWEVISGGIKWKLSNLGELGSVLKSDIQKLSSTVNKV